MYRCPKCVNASLPHPAQVPEKFLRQKMVGVLLLLLLTPFCALAFSLNTDALTWECFLQGLNQGGLGLYIDT